MSGPATSGPLPPLAPGAVMSPRARGELAVEALLERPPYVAGTREYAEYVKGLFYRAARAHAELKPNAAVVGRRHPDRSDP